MATTLPSPGAVAADQSDTCTDETYELLARDLRIPALLAETEKTPVVSEACKAWPYRPNLRLAAMAYNDGVEGEKSLVVAVIDTKAGRVTARHREAIVEDAITEIGANSLHLDTARYQLSPDVRAFGVRIDSAARGASCAEGYWGNDLTLYVPNGSTLQPVLGLSLYWERWLQGCPAAPEGAAREYADLKIGFAPTSSHGFRDIVVTATISAHGAVESGTPDTRVERHRFRYDGKRYRADSGAPWWLGP